MPCKSLHAWIKDRHIDLTRVVSEEDVKLKIILPYLKEHGYNPNTFKFEETIQVQIGTRRITVFCDILIPDSQNGWLLVIDAKKRSEPLTQTDLLQAISYAKLVSTPPVPLAVVTNGLSAVVNSPITGQEWDSIPTFEAAEHFKASLQSVRLTDEDLSATKRVMLTITNRDALANIFKRCKEILEGPEGIRADLSFLEMSKILVVKMSEERRVENQRAYRFTREYFETETRARNLSHVEVLRLLFKESKTNFHGIFSDQETIRLRYNDSVKEIVELLEPWSFLGTGEDIKGEVYEIFLKAQLRGSLGQYFTPRELVNFMVEIAQPRIGDKILDPACGSGGFLIRSFQVISDQIEKTGDPEHRKRAMYATLINDNLWGIEIDPSLHILSKINLIAHGDGYNHIYNGDGLNPDGSIRYGEVLEDTYDIVMTNPPFSLPQKERQILDLFELGRNVDSQETDVLFLEKCLLFLKPGGVLAIVLPEAFLNTDTNRYLRDFMLQNAHLIASVSLPGGAFVPFGQSHASTCILFLQKKDSLPPQKVFFAEAVQIGYECGKKAYKRHRRNDLLYFVEHFHNPMNEIQFTEWGGRSLWVSYNEIKHIRLDAREYFHKQLHRNLSVSGGNVVKLDEIAIVTDNPKIVPSLWPDLCFFYLEIPDIQDYTGMVNFIRLVRGEHINQTKLKFEPGDILFSRINPERRRVYLPPESYDSWFIPGDERQVFAAVTSTEIYLVKPRNAEEIDRYVLFSALRSQFVMDQVRDRITGTSSTRPRIGIQDFKQVLVPLPPKEVRPQISERVKEAVTQHWESCRQFLAMDKEMLKLYGDQMNIGAMNFE
jgi:type I restriction enzyme M protein